MTPSLDQATVRPQLERLALLGQMSRILGGHGWRIAISDKGIYARESAALAGDWRALCVLLRNSTVSRLLETFSCRAAGRALNADGTRSYLSFDDSAELVGRPAAGTALETLGKLIERGLILKCSRCRQEAWFALGAFSADFTCRRCGLEQPLQPGAWFGNSDPIWFYRPAEVLYQLLDHNGQLPLFAMERLIGESRGPTDFAHEVDIFDAAGEKHEIDLVLSIGSRLTLGEVSQTDNFGTRAEENKRFQHLRNLADLTNAARTVLATADATLRPVTITRAQSILGPTLEVLTGIGTVPVEA